MSDCRLGYEEHDGARYCFEHAGFLEAGVRGRRCDRAPALPHEFTEDVADASMCVCGVPALSHDHVVPPAACPDCGHQHTPEGCTGDPTPSDLWAGVSPSVCDCQTKEGSMKALDAMSFPAVCRSCRTLHDAGKVEVVARYSDCSCWRCPSCGLLLDDRPPRWGGTPTGDEARRMAREGACVAAPERGQQP